MSVMSVRRIAALPKTLPRSFPSSLSKLTKPTASLQSRRGIMGECVNKATSYSAPAATSTSSQISNALQSVYSKVQAATVIAGERGNSAFCSGKDSDMEPDVISGVTVVAVSKTKPVPLLLDAYSSGHRHFGENYVNEIVEKASQLPDDIYWHFIGHLQSNKAKTLVHNVRNLRVVETVDSKKIATYLNRACESSGTSGGGNESEDDSGNEDDKAKNGKGLIESDIPSGVRAEEPRTLDVLLQINTSGEESKNGINPDEASIVDLASHIVSTCPFLRVKGVMTIGMPDYTSTPENFTCLTQCRTILATFLGVEAKELTLSMGMSGDFQAAVEMGSTNVRVGSAIFGARQPKK